MLWISGLNKMILDPSQPLDSLQLTAQSGPVTLERYVHVHPVNDADPAVALRCLFCPPRNGCKPFRTSSLVRRKPNMEQLFIGCFVLWTRKNQSAAHYRRVGGSQGGGSRTSQGMDERWVKGMKPARGMCDGREEGMGRTKKRGGIQNQGVGCVKSFTKWSNF